MKIENETRYGARELRSLFTAVYRNLAKHEGPHRNWSGYRFTVVYSRRAGRVSGRAWVGGSSATIRLPRSRVNTELLANVVEHEMLHSYGYTHDSIGSRFTWSEANRAAFEWVTQRFGRSIEEKPIRKRAKPDLQEHRYVLAKAGIDRWERKLKVAQTRLTTLRRKARYYERAMAAKKAQGVA